MGAIGSFNDLKKCLSDDAFRYNGKGNGKLKLMLTEPGYRYIFWMRFCSYLKNNKLWFPVFLYARWRLRACSYRFGIQIPPSTRIGNGFYIGHFGGIVINPRATLGKNVNISQGVTIGQASRGPKKGCAEIGDCVYIGPGAKIVGAVKIGNHVAIGANAVVTKDLPDQAVAAGVPAKIISFNGSAEYIIRTV